MNNNNLYINSGKKTSYVNMDMWRTDDPDVNSKIMGGSPLGGHTVGVMGKRNQ